MARKPSPRDEPHPGHEDGRPELAAHELRAEGFVASLEPEGFEPLRLKALDGGDAGDLLGKHRAQSALAFARPVRPSSDHAGHAAEKRAATTTTKQVAKASFQLR